VRALQPTVGRIAISASTGREAGLAARGAPASDLAPGRKQPIAVLPCVPPGRQENCASHRSSQHVAPMPR
jgi:hypothetical protein